MISAVHTLLYSDDAPATRAFFRDVLGLPHVADGADGPDAGEQSWLIFATGPSELGVHPTSMEHDGEQVTAPRHHQVSLIVDDIEQAAETIRARGGTIVTGPADLGFGLGIEVAVPGTDAILIYQPRHSTAYRM